MYWIRKSILPVLLIASLAVAGYAYANRVVVCEDPIKYTLGSFDSRFNMSKTEFLAAVEDAAEIWEDSVDKDLFEYDSAAQKSNFFTPIMRFVVRPPVVVNLIYDERQMLADEHRTLVSEVNETKETADQLKFQLTSLQERHRREAAEYQQMLSEYRQRNISRETLEAKRLRVNAYVDEINTLVKRYNALVGVVNSTVRTINQTAGVEFEEGLYISDAEGERINIYEFGNRAALVRVLAHELGHAMGLEHNENSHSIMYYLNTSTNMQPTEEDIAGVLSICRGN